MDKNSQLDNIVLITYFILFSHIHLGFQIASFSQILYLFSQCVLHEGLCVCVCEHTYTVFEFLS
jgi:hypothetical protein